VSDRPNILILWGDDGAVRGLESEILRCEACALRVLRRLVWRCQAAS
jgi:hypothetical protein